MAIRQRRLRLKGVQSPEVAGILDCRIPIVNRQNHRSLRLSQDHQAVISGILEFCRKFAAESRIGKQFLWITLGLYGTDRTPGTVLPEESIVKAQVYWKGGEVTMIEVPRGKSGVHRYVSDPEMIELIRLLAREFSDQQIARILHRKGLRTPKGLPFATHHVSNLRNSHSIAKGPRVPVRGKDVYSAEQAAELFGVTRSTVIRWVEVGLLPGSQLTYGAPWRIQVTEQDMRKLKPTEVGEEWLTLKKAATVLGVSQQTVLQKLKSGQLEGVRVRTGRRSAWRIHVLTDTYSKQLNLL